MAESAYLLNKSGAPWRRFSSKSCVESTGERPRATRGNISIEGHMQHNAYGRDYSSRGATRGRTSSGPGASVQARPRRSPSDAICLQLRGKCLDARRLSRHARRRHVAQRYLAPAFPSIALHDAKRVARWATAVSHAAGKHLTLTTFWFRSHQIRCRRSGRRRRRAASPVRS